MKSHIADQETLPSLLLFLALQDLPAPVDTIYDVFHGIHEGRFQVFTHDTSSVMDKILLLTDKLLLVEREQVTVDITS